MSTIDNIQVDQVDMDTMRRLNAEFKQNYDQKVNNLTQTFH